MYLLKKVFFIKKLCFLYKKVKSLNVFEINDYDTMINTLCNPKKIKIVKKFLNDLINFVKNYVFYQLNLDTNFKIIKILFLSFYIHNPEFDNIIFNNKTEHNNKLKHLSLSISKNIQNCFDSSNTKNITFNITKIVFDFKEFYDLYKIWEKDDKRINTNNHLLNNYKIELKIGRLDGISEETRLVLRQQYEYEKQLIVNNIKFMNDKDELEYFMNNKDNILMFDKIKDELYWTKIKYEISCDNLYKKTLLSLLDKTKRMFIDCVPNRLDIHNEIHDVLDLTIIEQTLTKDDDDNIDYEYLLNKIHYILDLLKRFQAPADDAEYDIWCEDLMSQLANNVYFKDFIPYFFEKLFKRILKILEVSHKFKQI